MEGFDIVRPPGGGGGAVKAAGPPEELRRARAGGCGYFGGGGSAPSAGLAAFNVGSGGKPGRAGIPGSPGKAGWESPKAMGRRGGPGEGSPNWLFSAFVGGGSDIMGGGRAKSVVPPTTLPGAGGRAGRFM